MSLIENVKGFVQQITPRAATNQVVTTTQSAHGRMQRMLSAMESVVMPRDTVETHELARFIDDDVRERFVHD